MEKIESPKSMSFINKAAFVFAMGAILFAGAAEAKKFTVIEMNGNGTMFQPGISQKEMVTKYGTSGREVAQFECTVEKSLLADITGFANACWAAYASFLHPGAPINVPFITDKSKAEVQEYVDKLGEAGIEARAAKRVSRSAHEAPLPFGGINCFYLICEGDPVWKSDGVIDPEKTKFVGRPEDHVALAYARDMVFDSNGMSVGNMTGGMTKSPPGEMLYYADLAFGDAIETNPQGVDDFGYDERTILSGYWSQRIRDRAKSGKEIGEKLLGRSYWGPNVMGRNLETLSAFCERRGKSVLESPTSNIMRLNNDKVAAKLREKSYSRYRG